MLSLPNNVLFTLFAGESWGFSGSRRFVQGISTAFKCRTKSMGDVSSCTFKPAGCIEINQVLSA